MLTNLPDNHSLTGIGIPGTVSLQHLSGPDFPLFLLFHPVNNTGKLLLLHTAFIQNICS